MDLASLLIAASAALALFKFKRSVIQVLIISAFAGLAVKLFAIPTLI